MNRAVERNLDDRTWEQRLRRAFGALRTTDQKRAPSFEDLTAAEEPEAGTASNKDSEDPKNGVLPDHRQ